MQEPKMTMMFACMLTFQSVHAAPIIPAPINLASNSIIPAPGASTSTEQTPLELRLKEGIIESACDNPIAQMGAFYRWPDQNPGMGAPVIVVYDYPVYRSPLRCEFTGDAIKINVPADYGKAALTLSDVRAVDKNSKYENEEYQLKRIYLRKPAKSFVEMKLPHVMEMVLVHEGVGKTKNFANVVIPFQVSTNGGDYDMIYTIIGDAQQFPKRLGATGLVLASGSDEMNLDHAFGGDSVFSMYWDEAPVEGCPEAAPIKTRFLMRSNALTIGVDTFHQLMDILQNGPKQTPKAPPSSHSWIIGTCKKGTNEPACRSKMPSIANRQLIDVASMVQTLQTNSNREISEVRSDHAQLDNVLRDLKRNEGQGASGTSIQYFNTGVAKFASTKAAKEELEGINRQLEKYQKWFLELQTARYDEKKPQYGNGVSTLETHSSLGPRERNDCSALGLSPVNIDRGSAFDPSAALSTALVQPLSFRYMAQSEGGGHVQLSRQGHHLRVAVPPGSTEWALGGVLSSGVLRGVSYVDIHVPGEHSLDGHVPVAELQLVHESEEGKPAFAVAVPFELRDEANQWLTGILADQLPEGATKDIVGQPLGLLHTDLMQGGTSKYYRYDGSLTKPPCQQTEWFVLEQPGHISSQQLMQLGHALEVDVNPDKMWEYRGPSFMPSLVMKGSPQLVNNVQGSGLENAVVGRLRGRKRVVQM